MRLKQLDVRGFKSFADRTEFDFDADLTGIIGPNGCGKSNVVDALKWVLGDQRAKSLRGAEMTDVIFKGAEGRDGMQAAEVSVVLEDGTGLLGDRTEVRIGRRLTKDKESHYLIDGQPVRLKDVRDLLMDTGLGVGAYSVMEQGRIDAVLSANPESRRAIFEEAAGISKFKLQKRESLRKLDRTEQNLARVHDLLEERTRRIRSLRVQAGRAKRYRELRASIRDIKAALAVLDGRKLRATTMQLAADLETLQTQIATIETQYVAAGAEVDAQDAVIDEAGRIAEAALEELRVARSHEEQLEAKRDQLEKRSEELQADAQACDARVAELAQQRADRQRELDEARAQIEQLEQAAVDLHRVCEERQAATAAAQRAVSEGQEARERAREAVLETLHQRTRNRNAAHDQAVQKRTAVAAAERLDSRLADLAVDRSALDAEIEAGRARCVELAAQVRDLETREREVLDELEAADGRVAELARNESKKREEFASARSRLDLLEGMESHFEGLDLGPRYLLENQPAGLRGRLLDLLEIPLEESRALEAALGPYVQALVVDTRAHADAMLDMLVAEEKGRAMLLVEEEFSADLGVAPSASTVDVLAPPAGAVRLSDLVICEDSAKVLTRWLLRGVYLIDSLEDAQAGRHDLCYVTRDGRLLCGPRLEGGAGEGQGGLVVRRAQIQQLDEEADLLERDLSALRSDLELGTERAAALRDRVSTLSEEKGELRQQEQRATASVEQAQSRLADLDRQRQVFELEVADANRQRLAALLRLNDLSIDGLLVRARERAAEAQERELRTGLEELQQEASRLAAEEQQTRVEYASTRSEREARAARLVTLEQALVELDRAADDLDERRERAADGAAQARERCDALGREVADATSAILRTTEAADQARENLDAARARKAELLDALRATERERDAVRDEIGQKRLERSERGHEFARLEERLREETGIELRRCLGEVHGLGLEVREVYGPPNQDRVLVLLGPPVPAAMTEAERKLDRRAWQDAAFDVAAARREEKLVQSQIDRLGAVNLDAVTELEEEEGQIEQLERDVEDLAQARKSLIEALRTMELESRGLFERTFEQARENFRTIFRKLFQGGRADMMLQEGEDSLESGIDIVAKPPGKELQSIALLSGGERSLTALAILFAVFKVKPSPFCILDEVDAALDETNVERFLRVLDDFVGPSQFCIVTHHKRTMAHCQTLYGITMQRRGVSSRMAVSLGEVDDYTDGGAADPKARSGSDAPGANRIDPARKQRIAGEEQVGF